VPAPTPAGVPYTPTEYHPLLSETCWCCGVQQRAGNHLCWPPACRTCTKCLKHCECAVPVAG